MKTKLFFLVILSVISYRASFAQSNVEITGQVKDAENKKNLEFCTIAVFNKKDSLITGAVTNKNGFFAIQVPRGNYRFNFSFIGYQTDTLSDIIVTDQKFIGNIKLKPNVNFLNEVAVSTSANENTIDREVQIVTDKMKAGASSTKDVLDKLKGVEYDRYTNAIKVDNSDKVIILVDGMEKDQEYVKNIAPDRLKKVEVIRDPSGRYALEGYSAVINIILKKDYKGTEVFLSNNNLIDADASKSKYILVQESASATYNYTYNKLNLYTKLSTNYNSFNLNSSSIKEFVTNNMTIEQKPIDNDMNAKVKQTYNNIIFGTDYTINPKHTLSFEGNLSLQPFTNNISNESYHVIEKKNGEILGNYNLYNQAQSETVSSYYSLFYDGKIDEKNSFKSNVTFSNYQEKYENTNAINDIIFRNEIGNNLKNSMKFYVEFYHTFNEKHNIQVGYGNSFENMKNTFEIKKITANFASTDFRNKIYSYYSLQINKKIGLKIGGAAEISNPKSDIAEHNYTIFLPHGDLKYALSKNLNLKLKYRSNSNYPSIAQSNPFQSRIDNQSVRIGNPTLNPEVTHRLSLETNILSGLAKIEPYYHFSNNYIADIGNILNDSVMSFSYDNVGKYTNYGVVLNVTIPFGKRIFWQNDFDFFNTSIVYNDKTNSVNDFSMNSQLIYVYEKTGLVCGAKYQKQNRKYLTAQGFNRWNNDFWLAFVQKPFFKQRMSVMVAYISPILYGVNTTQGSFIKTDRYTEIRTNDISILKNIFVIELSYRFNKGKTVNKKMREVDVKDEKTSRGIM